MRAFEHNMNLYAELEIIELNLERIDADMDYW